MREVRHGGEAKKGLAGIPPAGTLLPGALLKNPGIAAARRGKRKGLPAPSDFLLSRAPDLQSYQRTIEKKWTWTSFCQAGRTGISAASRRLKLFFERLPKSAAAYRIKAKE